MKTIMNTIASLLICATSFSQGINLLPTPDEYEFLALDNVGLNETDFSESNGFLENDTLVLVFAEPPLENTYFTFYLGKLNYDTLFKEHMKYITQFLGETSVLTNSFLDMGSDTIFKLVRLTNDLQNANYVKIGNVILKVAFGDVSNMDNFVIRSSSVNKTYFLDVANLTSDYLADWLENPTVFLPEDGGEDNVSISQVSNVDIVVYPNPVTDVLKVEGLENLNYTIVDVTGKVVSHGTIDSKGFIPVNDLNKGKYLLTVNQNSIPFVK